MGIHLFNIWCASPTPRPHTKCGPVVVLLHRNVRFFSELLPRRFLVASIFIRWGSLYPLKTTAAVRAHPAPRYFRRLQTVPLDLGRLPLPWHGATLQAYLPLDEISIPRYRRDLICHVIGTIFLLSLGLCWKWERKLLLRHYFGVEPGSQFAGGCGHAIRGVEGRVGTGKARYERSAC